MGGGGGGGRIYETKTLHSNLAPEEGGGRFFEGGHIIEQVRYMFTVYMYMISK